MEGNVLKSPMEIFQHFPLVSSARDSDDRYQ